CWVQRVDIEAQIGRCIFDHSADPSGDDLRSGFVDVLGGDDGHPLTDGPVEDLAVHRRANADLDRAVRVYETLLDRVIERRPVSKDQAEAFRPGIDMTVEMHQTERTLSARQRAQQCKRNRVVTAERDEVPERRRLRLDLGRRARDLALTAPDIADSSK